MLPIIFKESNIFIFDMNIFDKTDLICANFPRHKKVNGKTVII